MTIDTLLLSHECSIPSIRGVVDINNEIHDQMQELDEDYDITASISILNLPKSVNVITEFLSSHRELLESFIEKSISDGLTVYMLGSIESDLVTLFSTTLPLEEGLTQLWNSLCEHTQEIEHKL